ncbi:hypothetical protein [Streptomyces cacaoi]|uniref:hypothetical protein n=1 Tax=Streptomyces cacaoi TaxID=1898 RepID=UPI0011F2AA55|nr:hypothetical protein [Streptomyces cacaoi]
MNDRTTSARTRIRLRGTAAVCAVTGALLLGACGSDDSGDKSGEIKGADKGSTSPTASASGSPGDDIERPEIKLGKDAENVFEKTETGDPTKDRVLADNQEWINAADQIITRHTGVKALEFYGKGSSLENANAYVRSWVENDRSWTGKVRYYDQSVDLEGKNKAVVTFCIDQSGGTTKDLKTGKTIPNDGGKKNFGYNTAHFERDKNGVWQSVSEHTESEAERCMK